MPAFLKFVLAGCISLVVCSPLALATPNGQTKPQWLAAYGKMSVDGSYYSGTTGEFIVNLYDEGLPWGTQVVIHYGFTKGEFQNGKLVPVANWQNSNSEKVPAIGPFKWGKKITQQLYGRGSSTQLTHLVFKFEVTLPDGTQHFLPRQNGYYSAGRPLEQSGCNAWGESYCSLNLSEMSSN